MRSKARPDMNHLAVLANAYASPTRGRVDSPGAAIKRKRALIETSAESSTTRVKKVRTHDLVEEPVGPGCLLTDLYEDEEGISVAFYYAHLDDPTEPGRANFVEKPLSDK